MPSWNMFVLRSSQLVDPTNAVAWSSQHALRGANESLHSTKLT